MLSNFPDSLRPKLAELVQDCRDGHPSDAHYPFDAQERAEAANVRAALHLLGHEVSLAQAAFFWEAYSHTLMAGWLFGAESVDGATQGILAYCRDPLGMW